jgi:ribosomal protein S1
MDGRVESITDFGVFVKLENGITGLVHISELSHTRFENPNEVVKPGDTIRVKVLRVQTEDRRVSLSAKACERDPWAEVFSKYQVGQQVTGPIKTLMQSGAILQLDNFFEAFIPVSEIAEERIKHPKDVLNEGEDATGTILSIDGAKRRIRVSLRRTSEEATSQQPSQQESYIETEIKPTAGKVTLGDFLAGKLDLSAASKKDKAPEVAAEAKPEPVPAVVAEIAAEDVEEQTAAAEAEVEAAEAEAVALEVEETGVADIAAIEDEAEEMVEADETAERKQD